MPVTHVCSSTSISTTPRPSSQSGVHCSKRATTPSFGTSPGSPGCSPGRRETATRSGERSRHGRGAAAPEPRLDHAVPGPGRAGGSRRSAPRVSPSDPGDRELLGGVAAAMALVKAHRMHGHLAARLDPLGAEPIGDPALDPLRLEPKLTPELQARIPTSILRIHVDGDSLKEALPRLKETYCGPLGYEMEHIGDHEQRVWLRKAIESWRFRTPLEPDGATPPLRAALRDRGDGALPPPLVPRPEAVLARGPRRADPDARRVDRARRRIRRARGRSRHGPPRPAQRPRPHDRHAVRADPPRVRRRADDRGRRRRRRGRNAATSSTTSAPRESAPPRAARSPSRSPRTRATSRRSTPSSRG